MPLYEFRCSRKKCEHVFDVPMSMKEVGEKKVRCPECKALAKKLMSGSLIIIKGEAPRSYTPLKRNTPKSQIRSAKTLRVKES